MNIRYLIVNNMSCPYCPKWYNIVEEINAMISPEERINIIDTSEYDEYNINLYPILNRLGYGTKKGIIGVPTLVWGDEDGIILIEGMSTKEYAKYLLIGLLGKDEENE